MQLCERCGQPLAIHMGYDHGQGRCLLAGDLIDLKLRYGSHQKAWDVFREVQSWRASQEEAEEPTMSPTLDLLIHSPDESNPDLGVWIYGGATYRRAKLTISLEGESRARLAFAIYIWCPATGWAPLYSGGAWWKGGGRSRRPDALEPAALHARMLADAARFLEGMD